jgi:hypothetical protein
LHANTLLLIPANQGISEKQKNAERRIIVMKLVMVARCVTPDLFEAFQTVIFMIVPIE